MPKVTKVIWEYSQIVGLFKEMSRRTGHRLGRPELMLKNKNDVEELARAYQVARAYLARCKHCKEAAMLGVVNNGTELGETATPMILSERCPRLLPMM